jgi:hypothetical protein
MRRWDVLLHCGSSAEEKSAADRDGKDGKSERLFPEDEIEPQPAHFDYIAVIQAHWALYSF